MTLAFLGNPLVQGAIAIVVGAAGVLLVEYLTRLSGNKKLAKIRRQYPVFNLVLAAAGNSLEKTTFGSAFRIAQGVLSGAGVDPRDVDELAQLMVDRFDIAKYTGTDFKQLDERQLAQGEAIARSVLPNYREGTIDEIAHPSETV